MVHVTLYRVEQYALYCPTEDSDITQNLLSYQIRLNVYFLKDWSNLDGNFSSYRVFYYISASMTSQNVAMQQPDSH